MARNKDRPYGYNPDQWSRTVLKEGTKLVSGVPGQSSYYSSAEHFEIHRDNKESYWQSLQVPKGGPLNEYRGAVQEYILKKDTKIPTSKAEANPDIGTGGGPQYFVSSHLKSRLNKNGETKDFYNEKQ